MYNFTNNYTNATVTCTLQGDNITSICHGEFATIQLNTDLITALLTIMAFSLLFVVIYIIYKETLGK